MVNIFNELCHWSLPVCHIHTHIQRQSPTPLFLMRLTCATRRTANGRRSECTLSFTAITAAGDDDCDAELEEYTYAHESCLVNEFIDGLLPSLVSFHFSVLFVSLLIVLVVVQTVSRLLE